MDSSDLNLYLCLWLSVMLLFPVNVFSVFFPSLRVTGCGKDQIFSTIMQLDRTLPVVLNGNKLIILGEKNQQSYLR